MTKKERLERLITKYEDEEHKRRLEGRHSEADRIRTDASRARRVLEKEIANEQHNL